MFRVHMCLPRTASESIDTHHQKSMKRATETQVASTCAEYATACLTKLYNSDPSKPAMTLSIGHIDAATGYVKHAVDFVKDVNEDRLKEYDWIFFFKALMTSFDSASVSGSVSGDGGAATTDAKNRYRPSDDEVAWAGRVAIAITSGNLAKMRALLDKGPGPNSGFNITVPIQMAQSIPDYDDSESAGANKTRAIRGELVVNADYGTVDILLEPFSRQSEIERLGYKRLLHATICWFIYNNMDVMDLVRMQQPKDEPSSWPQPPPPSSSQKPDDGSVSASDAEPSEIYASLRSLTI